MKIRAIRLKEVARFSAPIALEGLSGGLDVLAGPNEFGKSTILRAVRAALFEQHRSKHRKLEALRPYSGGAPMVELDLEIAGRSWRLRKQFLSAPAAELRDLNSGATMRGADAEAELARLLGGTGGFALLCVEQGSPLAALTPVATGGRALMAAIEGEVANITDGSAVRFVAERVKEELAALVTSHNPPRPTGKYKAAQDELQRLEAQRSEAQRRFDQAQQRLGELEVLRGELARLTNPETESARNGAATEARRLFAEAHEARQKQQTAEAAIASCERQRSALQTVLEGFDRQVSQLAKLEEAAHRAMPLLAAAETRAQESAAQALGGRTTRDDLVKALAALERQRRAIEARERLQQAAQRLTAARAAHAEYADASASLATTTADERSIEAARREAAGIATLEARLSAAAPTISLAYATGGAGKIRVGGRALADGETLNPTRSVTLEIEGVGTITVAPGQSADVAEDEADLAARREQLATLLQRCGASSLEEAQQLFTARRAVEARIAAAATQLKASAPEGLERLQCVHAELTTQAAALGSIDADAPEDLEPRIRAVGDALAAAEEKLGAALREEQEAREGLAGLRARVAGNDEQIKRYSAELGDAEARATTREDKRAAFAEAEAMLNAAVREGAAWREKAPSDARFAELKRAAEDTAAACKRAEGDIARLRHSEAGLEGALRSDSADDVAARLDELTGTRALAHARCLDLQDEVAALQLLARELEASATGTRERFAKPVIERVAPYLQQVLPQARLDLDDELAPQLLARGTASEELARLSDGTQEQLALIVRLAFARLLADNGAPAPLILDDALVYADDARIQRMFAALRHAAQSHQVLVLTCREQAFQDIGGNRVRLSTWEDARVAA